MLTAEGMAGPLPQEPPSSLGLMSRNRERFVRLSNFVCAAMLASCGASDDCGTGSQSSGCEEEALPEWPAAYGAQLELQDEASALFERYHPGRIDLTVSPKLWREVHEKAVELDDSTTFVSIEISIDGEELGAVGFRPKGGSGTLRNCIDDQELADALSSRNLPSDDELIVVRELPWLECPKLSYKLKFDKFQKQLKFKGLDRLNLHSLVKDGAKMREFLAYGLYRRMGIAAPRVNYTELFVNGEPLGLYSMVEELDETFLESRFPEEPDGNLYKDVWFGGRKAGSLDSALRTNDEGEPDHSGLVQATKEFLEADDETLPDVVARWFDVSTLVSFIEVEQAMWNWDGPLSIRYEVDGARDNFFSHNFYLYQGAPDSKFTLIPWDMDNALDGRHPRVESQPDYRELPEDCINGGFQPGNRGNWFYIYPGCDPLVRAAALGGSLENRTRLLSEVFQEDLMQELIDWQVRRLTPSVRRDPSLRMKSWEEEVDTLRDAVRKLVKRAAEFEG